MTLMKLRRLSAPKLKSRFWLPTKKNIRRRLVPQRKRKNLKKNLKKRLRSLQLKHLLLLLLPLPLTKRRAFSML